MSRCQLHLLLVTILVCCGLSAAQSVNATVQPTNLTSTDTTPLYNVTVGPVDWSTTNTVRVVAQFAAGTVNVTILNTTVVSDMYSVLSQPQYGHASAGINITVDTEYADTNTTYAYVDVQSSTSLTQSQSAYTILYSEWLNITSYLHTSTLTLAYITALNEYCIDSNATLTSCPQTQTKTNSTAVVLTTVEPVFLNSIYTGAACVLLVCSYMYIGVYRVSRPRVSQTDFETLWPAKADEQQIKLVQVAPAPYTYEYTDVQPFRQPPSLRIDPVFETPKQGPVMPKHAFVEPVVPKISVDHNGRVTNLQSAPSNTALYSHTPSASVSAVQATPHGYTNATPHYAHRIDNSIRRSSVETSQIGATPSRLYTKRTSMKQIMDSAFNTGGRRPSVPSMRSSIDNMQMVSRIDDD